MVLTLWWPQIRPVVQTTHWLHWKPFCNSWKNLCRHIWASYNPELQSQVLFTDSRIHINPHMISADCRNASLQYDKLVSLEVGYNNTITNVTALIAETSVQTWRTSTLTVCEAHKSRVAVEKTQLQSSCLNNKK